MRPNNLLNENVAEKVGNDLVEKIRRQFDLINQSFLSAEQKEKYVALLESRLARL